MSIGMGKPGDKKHLQTNVNCEAVTVGQGNQEHQIHQRAIFTSSLHHWKTCTHNPGHENFIPVKSFSLEHLPEVLKTEKVYKEIKLMIDLTVRLVVSGRSSNRPIDPCYASTGSIWTGTGTVVRVEKCNSHNNIHSVGGGQNNTYVITIRTACHVVFDSFEASNCSVDFFYDNEIDKKEVKRICGTSVRNKNVEDDLCDFECITTDKELAWFLDSTLKSLSFSDGPTYDKISVIVSHPHGLSKHISIGRWNYGPSCEDDFSSFNGDSIYFSLFPFMSILVNKASAGLNPPFSEPVGIECDIHYPDGERSKCHIWQIDRLVKYTKEALIIEGGIHIPADQLCLELDLGNGEFQVMKDEQPLEYYWDDLTITCTIIMRRINQ